MRLHPYAIILGLGVGVFAFFTLRHPLFAIFGLIIATLGFDILLKKRIDKDKPE